MRNIVSMGNGGRPNFSYGPAAAIVIHLAPDARLRGLRSATYFARKQTGRRMAGMRPGIFRLGVFSVSLWP